MLGKGGPELKKLRVLVFSATFGNGHLRAAEAVIEGIRLKQPSAEVIHLDFGDFLSKRVNTMVKNVYSEMIKRTPKLWGRLYYKTSRVQPRSMVQRLLNQLGRNDFLKYIDVFEPDLIVCTYPTVSSILAELRLEEIIHVPLITVITDFTAHSLWVHPGVDRYIVACTEVKEILVSWGIDIQRIHVTGIPISPRFDGSFDSQQIIRKLGLDPALPIFLVMGGAYGGLKSTKRICKKLADSIVPVQSIIVCGKNRKLFRSLEEVSVQSVNPIVRLGFVHNVEELMTVSKLIITKAGGLTVSEALTKHLPLVIFKPIPGQEDGNAQFVQRIGAGHVASSEEELEQLLDYLLNHPEDIEKMRERAAVALPGRSTERAVDDMLELALQLKETKKKIG